MKQKTKASDSAPFLTTRDFMVTGESFELIPKGPDGLLQTQPMPADTAPYYRSEAYLSHTDGNKTLFEKLYLFLKSFNLNSKLRLLKGLQKSPGALLDFGAGTGDFLAVAKRAGWGTFGVEPNAGARQRALQKGVQVWSDLTGLPAGQYDCISLWHVLEHLPDPGATMGELRNRLKDSGHLVVAVPNYRSLDAQIYGSHWAAYDTPRHLWHFSRASLRVLSDEWGFELVSEKPQWLDAYYVSWLSEKYRRNPLAPVRAFCVATLSNLAALFSGESSSRIYIFRKKDVNS